MQLVLSVINLVDRDEAKANQRCKPCEHICVGDGNQDRLEVPECPDDDNCDEEEEKESLSGAN